MPGRKREVGSAVSGGSISFLGLVIHPRAAVWRLGVARDSEKQPFCTQIVAFKNGKRALRRLEAANCLQVEISSVLCANCCHQLTESFLHFSGFRKRSTHSFAFHKRVQTLSWQSWSLFFGFGNYQHPFFGFGNYGTEGRHRSIRGDTHKSSLSLAGAIGLSADRIQSFARTIRVPLDRL